jgi:copper transport protein
MNVGSATLRRLAGVAAIVVCAVAALTFRAAPVAAHAQFDHSDPPANSVLSATPTRIQTYFTESLEHSYSRLLLYDENGTLVQGTQTLFDATNPRAMVLVLPSTALPNGTYSVVWRTLSADDGHQAQGYFAFTLGTAADIRSVIPPAAAVSAGTSLWLLTLARWLPLLGLAFVVAAWPIWLLVMRPAISPAWQAGPNLTRRYRRLVVFGFAFSLIALVAALLIEASGLDSGSFFSDVKTSLGTRYGHLWLLRLGLLALLGMALMICAWWRPLQHKAVTLLALALTIAAPLPYSLISHASAESAGRSTAIAADLVHLLGAAIWVGGLFYLVGALLPELRRLTPAGRRVVLGRALPRFSFVALTAWVLMGITGLYSAWLHVGNLDGLFHTAYGHSLDAKLVLLAVVLPFAAFNLLVVERKLRQANDEPAARRWTKRFTIAVVAEALLVIAVLFTVGRLTAQSPARDEVTLAANQVTLPLNFDGRAATLTLAPGKAGPNHYRLDVSGDTLPAKTEALIRLAPAAVNTGLKEITLVRSAGNVFEWHGSELSFEGNWTLTVIVRDIGSFQWQQQTTLPIKAATDTAGVPRPAWHFGTAGIFGLILGVLGVIGVAIAWRASTKTLRRESLGLGAAALAVAAVLLLQSRVTPVEAISLNTPNPIAMTNDSIERGKTVFQANCIACHGVAGRGDGPLAQTFNPPAADFTSPHAFLHVDAEFFNWIKEGKPGTAMPAFIDKLTDNDIWDVINYIRASQAQSKGTPVAALGGTPVATHPHATPTP